nr:MAG TPA: hypothetical protein [Caudoviricetes sp.]
MAITKTYSKKQANTIITNAIIKLTLMKKDIEKESIKQYLILNNITDDLINYFNGLKRSQIKSFKDYANKQIEKFNLKHEAEIILNEYELNLSLNDVKLLFNDDKDISFKNIKDKMLLILMSFRKDNMNIKI